MMMRREYDFGDFWNQMSAMSTDVNCFFEKPKAALARKDYPPVKVYNEDEAFVVRVEVPGTNPSELDVQATEDSVTISVDRKKSDPTDPEKSSKREGNVGAFTRTISLGEPVDPEKINASYKYGVLEVTLPKAERLKPRKIEITS